MEMTNKKSPISTKYNLKGERDELCIGVLCIVLREQCSKLCTCMRVFHNNVCLYN